MVRDLMPRASVRQNRVTTTKSCSATPEHLPGRVAQHSSASACGRSGPIRTRPACRPAMHYHALRIDIGSMGGQLCAAQSTCEGRRRNAVDVPPGTRYSAPLRRCTDQQGHAGAALRCSAVNGGAVSTLPSITGRYGGWPPIGPHLARSRRSLTIASTPAIRSGKRHGGQRLRRRCDLQRFGGRAGDALCLRQRQVILRRALCNRLVEQTLRHRRAIADTL